MRRVLWYIAAIIAAWLLAQVLMRGTGAEALRVAQGKLATPWLSWTPRPTATITPTKWPTHYKTPVPSRTATKAPTRTPTPTLPECGEWEPGWSERYQIIAAAWLACGMYEDDATATSTDPLLVCGLNDFDLGGPLGARTAWRAGEVVLRPFCKGILIWRPKCWGMMAISWAGDDLRS